MSATINYMENSEDNEIQEDKADEEAWINEEDERGTPFLVGVY